MAQSRFQIAKADIFKYFDELSDKVYHRADLAKILSDNRLFWRLTQSTTVTNFINLLIHTNRLSEYEFPFPKPYKQKKLYVWDKVPLYEIIQGISPKCYFSHYTAMKIHGLTEQSPKIYYINEEQKLGSWLAGKLSQASINAAFKQQARVTKKVAQTQDYTVIYVNGKNTNELGVIDYNDRSINREIFGKIRVTNIERTLIDCAVRPAYAGGVPEVLKAFQIAGDTISVNRLSAMLKKMEFIYPYHQVIGFYLDKAGHNPTSLDLFRQTPMEFDFYLEHGMKTKAYNKEWKLFVPEGF